MRLRLLAAAMAATVLLGGCAAQVVRSTGSSPAATKVSVPAASSQRVLLHLSGSPAALKSADWEAFKGEWRDAFAAEAAAAGITFAMREGASAAPDGQAGTLVAVHVNDYRYVSAGARWGLGVMTGNAFVDAKLGYRDAKSGATFGDDTVNTSSSAWQGIFAAMTSKQLQAIAHDVVADIKPR